MLIYGDSLIEQASPYLQSTDEIRAFGGTALCDWVDNMARAATFEQPSVMVVEFVGNDTSPCMHGYETPDQVRAKYEADMARLKQLVDSPILWVGPPAFRDRTPAGIDLYSSEPRFVDAGEAVLADGAYTDTLPCLADEGVVQGCVNGQIRVRAPDGAHFADVRIGLFGRRTPLRRRDRRSRPRAGLAGGARRRCARLDLDLLVHAFLRVRLGVFLPGLFERPARLVDPTGRWQTAPYRPGLLRSAIV